MQTPDEYHTIDSLIAVLNAKKNAGTPGDTAVVVASLDNNGKAGFARRVMGISEVALAKPDVEKGWEVCKLVSNRGVKSLMIW